MYLERMLLLMAVSQAFSGVPNRTFKQCLWNTTSTEVSLVPCLVPNDSELCLVCPMDISASSDVIWRRHDEKIFLNGHRLVDDNISLDVCHPTFSSLYIPTVTFNNANETYQCKRQNGTTVTFILRIIGHPTLSISTQSAGSFCSEIIKKLECIATEVLQPVTMKWTMNNNEISSKTLYEISNQTVAWTKTFNNLKETDVIKCKVSAPYITQVTTSFNCSRNDEELDSPFAVFVIFTIISLVLTGIGVTFIICKKKYTGAICRVTNTNRVARSERKDSVTVVYSKPSTNEERENIDTVEDDGISNSISLISKGTCLKIGEKFEYWKSSFTNVINEEKHCIVKTLTDNSTITEAAEFRKLAKRLKTLRKNTFIVDLLSVSLDIVPSIAYMFMEFGTLRDLLLMRYEKTRKSHISTKVHYQIEGLISLSYDVACAMRFLASKKYCHPVLSTRKVLLTEECRCKIYDICPEDMALVNAKRQMEKKFPPIMWLSPEAVFMKEYSIESDVWNFGVFLWETFSIDHLFRDSKFQENYLMVVKWLTANTMVFICKEMVAISQTLQNKPKNEITAEVPCAGLMKSQLEEKIRQTIILTQPVCCPGALYSLMLMCWCHSKGQRPTMEALHKQVKTLLEGLDVSAPNEDVGSSVKHDIPNYDIVNPD